MGAKRIKYVLIEKFIICKCAECKEVLPATLDFFYNNRMNKHHIDKRCKKCRILEYVRTLKKEWIHGKTDKPKSKICTVCKTEKAFELFPKEKRAKNGRRNQCKTCRIKSNKISYKKHGHKYVERKKETDKIWTKKNRSRRNKTNKLLKRTKKHKDVRNKHLKERRDTDVLFKLKENLKNSIRNSFKRKKHYKTNKTIEILGCTFEEFRIYIESQFESWMNWENYGKYETGKYNVGWDLDHFEPIASAATKEDVIRLNRYTNFRPLCSYINRVEKRDKILTEKLQSWNSPG